MKEIIISGNEANQRLDKFLAKLLNKAPKSFYYKMLRKKTIVLNGKKASGSEKLKEGDAVKLFLAEDTFLKFTSQKQALHTGVKLDILYEDDHVIMINKPAGMLSQKSRDGDISLVEHLISYLLETGAVTQAELATFSPSVCNRLDRNTSGLVTAGKSMIGLQTLSGWFRDRTVRKYYRCLVKGQVSESQKAAGYLKKDRQNNQVEISERPISDSRIETEYRPIRTGKEATLLEVHLITGRTHQIRAHLAYLGHPVIGDPKYGDERTNQTYREKYRLKTQLLHAYRLEIPEVEGPLSYLSGREFLAPVPRLFREICEKQEVM